jgi:hypothetical protein
VEAGLQSNSTTMRSILAFVAVGLIAQVLCAGREADTSRGCPAVPCGAGRWARCERQSRTLPACAWRLAAREPQGDARDGPLSRAARVRSRPGLMGVAAGVRRWCSTPGGCLRAGGRLADAAPRQPEGDLAACAAHGRRGRQDWYFPRSRCLRCAVHALLR